MDTIVMANLGYLQLKSSPGRWLMRLREGRSAELYDIVSVDGHDTNPDADLPILISSFQSKIGKNFTTFRTVCCCRIYAQKCIF